jgi:cob(I)alamin adenosyltransferase
MAYKIYTKTGDKGNTSLIGGTKVSKGDLRIESYGNVDELNAHVGLVNDLLKMDSIESLLSEVQDRLFTIGSALACDPEKDVVMKIPDLHESDVLVLEKEIDEMTEQLAPLTAFILPGGHPTISHLHIARCVCRRAERSCVRLQDAGGEVLPLIVIYLNRLSDYLFVLTRYAAFRLQVVESTWVPRT